jgi:hypothetical protein
MDGFDAWDPIVPCGMVSGKHPGGLRSVMTVEFTGIERLGLTEPRSFRAAVERSLIASVRNFLIRRMGIRVSDPADVC